MLAVCTSLLLFCKFSSDDRGHLWLIRLDKCTLSRILEVDCQSWILVILLGYSALLVSLLHSQLKSSIDCCKSSPAFLNRTMSSANRRLLRLPRRMLARSKRTPDDETKTSSNFQLLFIVKKKRKKIINAKGTIPSKLAIEDMESKGETC